MIALVVTLSVLLGICSMFVAVAWVGSYEWIKERDTARAESAKRFGLLSGLVAEWNALDAKDVQSSDTEFLRFARAMQDVAAYVDNQYQIKLQQRREQP